MADDRVEPRTPTDVACSLDQHYPEADSALGNMARNYLTLRRTLLDVLHFNLTPDERALVSVAIASGNSEPPARAAIRELRLAEDRNERAPD